MIRRYVYITILAVLLPIVAGATFYKHYTTSQSLLSNTVYFVFRDSKGFMWFATDKGVMKYDGNTFRSFTVLDGLGDNEVFNIFEDSKSCLWLYTYNGSPCYIRNDSVFNTTNDPFLRTLPTRSYIHAMYEHPAGTLYIGYYNGELLKLWDGKQKYIKHDHASGGLRSILYSASDVDLVMETSEYRTWIKDGKVVADTFLGYHVLYQYPRGSITADTTGLYYYKDGRLEYKLEQYGIDIRNIIHVYLDDRDNIFIGSVNGLYIINIVSGQRQHLYANLKITGIERDIYGNYWVTTHDNGIYMLSKELDGLQYIRDVSNTKLFFKRDGTLFFTEKDSVYYLADTNLKIRKVNMFFPGYMTPVAIHDGHFFYTPGDTSYLFNMQTKRSQYFMHLLKQVYQFNDGKILFVAHYNIYTAYVSHGNLVFPDSVTFKYKIKETVMNKVDSNLFFLSGKSLYRYDPFSENLTQIDSMKGFEAIVSLFIVDNRIVAMTNNRKMIIYDPYHGNTKKVIGSEDIVLFDFFALGGHRYLMNTNKGYYTLYLSGTGLGVRMDKVEYPFRGSDILALYPSGEKIVANIGGKLYAFDKRLLNRALDRPVMFVNSVMFDGEELGTGKAVITGRNSCDLTVNVNALGFNNSRNDYQYRLVTDDETSPWLDNEGNKLNVVVPAPGEYMLEVRAVTENRIHSAIHAIPIILTPPFYNSVYFYMLCAIIVVVLLFYILRMLQHRRQRIFQNELNYLQMEHRSINSLLNPHFVFNTINNIQNLVNEQSGTKANEYLANMSKLIRQNVENLQFNFIPVEKELSLIRNYIHLQNLRFNDRIRLDINNEIPVGEVVNVPPLLIHTFVENAIIHGFDKSADSFNISIQLEISTDDYLVVTVTDDGIGYNASRTNAIRLTDKTPMGIEFNRRRLQRLSDFYHTTCSLTVTDLGDTGQKGTKVVIMLYAKFTDLQ